MPILKLTGGKTLSVSQKKADEIISWKTERTFDPSKLVDVGSDNFLSLSEIKGVLSDNDYINGSDEKRIDLDDPTHRETVLSFERRLDGKSVFQYAIERGVIFDKTHDVDGRKIFNYVVNIDRHSEWSEYSKLWSALQELRGRREYDQRKTDVANHSLLEGMAELKEKMKA